MTSELTFRWGRSDSEPTVDQMREALSELDAHDPEHGDAFLQHESGWCLSAYESGLLAWENVESGPPRHMSDVPRAVALRLWIALSRGDFATIEKEAWLPGYG